jgi:DNA-binding transcriptional LysR family regulator
MDLRSLRHVVVLARLLSYRQAAEELGLTQSALSRSIQALERRAEVRLFDRDRAGVRLTAVGRAFVERAQALLREADALERSLSRHASGAEGTAAFGMAPLMAAALAPAVLGETLATTPDLRCHVLVRSVGALLPLLLNEQIEFIVCSERQIPDDAPVKGTLLGRFPTSLLVRAGHPLLSPDGGRAGAPYPLIVSAPFVQEGLESSQARVVKTPPQLVLEDHAGLLRLTEGGDAVWMGSSYAVAEEIAAGRIRELPPQMWPYAHGGGRFRVMMYGLDRRSLSPAALRLQDLLRARIGRLTQLLG